MVQYIVRHRKDTSMRQKAHIRKLNQRRSEPESKDRASDSSGTGAPLDKPASYDVSTPNVLLRSKNKPIEDLKKKYKNAKQREKRAKIKIAKLEDRANQAYSKLAVACKDTSNAEEALESEKAKTDTSTKEITMLRDSIAALEKRVSHLSYELLCATQEIEKQEKKASSLRFRWISAHRAQDALRKKVKRIQSHSKSGVSVTQSQKTPLKDSSGTIRPAVRDMLRKLTCKGVATEHITDVIHIVAEGLGVGVIGTVSARSVGRIMFEGLVQATMQIAHEIQQAKFVSLCGDGTTIQNQQHESKSLYLQMPAYNTYPPSSNTHSGATLPPVLRTLGVCKAVNHMAQQQFKGWLNTFDNCCRTLTMSPLGQSCKVTSRMVAPKLRGILTDHAADQKRFVELMVEWKKKCDPEVRAVGHLGKLTTKQQLTLLSSYLDSATACVDDWKTLPAEEQSAMMHDAWFALAFEIGESELQKLGADTQFDADFVAWVGCCMHKELNAVKGGTNKMSKAWDVLNLIPPLALRNKIEAELGSQAVRTNGPRGAIRLLRLAGYLFNHQDDKKGYQKVVDNFFQKLYGYSKQFPDTSNTRYGSYCDAAIELILHWKDYLRLMERVCAGKAKPEFVNIERNVYEGLQDTPTVTELVVLALYAQAVGYPYMRYVRGTGMGNAVELGQFHDRVKRHCQMVAQNPDLLLGKNPSFKTAVLDGQPWDSPDVISRVSDLAPSLPHLRQMLVAFFEGALETWERFTSEFEPDGVIAQATAQQRQSAWIPATNDVSEGALGRCRQMLRRAPNMTDNQRNARVMWQDNQTADWAKATLTDEDEIWIRKQARLLDSSGEEKKLRAQMDNALEERAAAGRDRQRKALARKSNKQLKLASIRLIEDATYEKLSTMRVKELDEQIDKLRELGGTHIRPKTMIGNKQAKIKELLAALENHAKSTISKLHSEPSENGLASTEVEGSETFDYGDCPDDLELCYDDEMAF